ncbi:UDP-N-acetylmuramate dehydrogenase [Zooshikella sp. WH53]|uniref:UDP-N-acetylenolpyruvoylglucosamine reductase n=1 Tax=Zooshikella harenae TaxID=2827238 RepID=A0ABS5ZC38_9GAMM|nr:UDP-N-acetylmuramate dehydrogenase [Zooshikella harenae]
MGQLTLQPASLKPWHTLGFEVKAQGIIDVFSEEDIHQVLSFARQHDLPVLPLGEGSNTIFAKDFAGIVMRVCLQGRRMEYGADGQLMVYGAAGENWHGFVRWALDQGAYGLENLSLIPGTVGASPIQNIGAYGVEVKDLIDWVRYIDIASGKVVQLKASDCVFGYRDSIFKQQLRDQIVITEVAFCLSSHFKPNLSYMGLHDSQAETALQLSDYIVKVREAKLPDPQNLGNVGSFFKNPIISEDHYQALKENFPNLVAYSVGEGDWKLAAGWLIDQCGFKGIRKGNVGVYKQQALVLVHFGEGYVEDLLSLAWDIQQQVWLRFSVRMEIEPRIYPQ